MAQGKFATRWNLDALEDNYQRWQHDPDSVDERWQLFFEGFQLGLARTPAAAPTGDTRAQGGIFRLIYAYRNLGHFLARIDPLSPARASHPLLELSVFGLQEADLDRTFDTSMFLGLERATLRELLRALRETYCRTIGIEYMHIQDSRMRLWLQQRMEPRRNRPGFSPERKLWVLKRLYYAELFERFLHTRFVGQKRFSLEGAETAIPILEELVEKAGVLGVREMVLGMAHRGRLNVLSNILRKPYEDIFSEFEENFLPNSTDGDGDVKYHLGFSSDRVTQSGQSVHLSLTPNPSHLEAVNPVVLGRTRAKQTQYNDVDRVLGLPVLIHGDAAFAGQGLVAETLNLSQLQGYTTGGTVHLIINNQIGFTTAPTDARSTVYCTDVAKMLQVPIFHVNAEDPEAAVYVAELAMEFRQEWGRDAVIDMVCYRRHGHNEGDEPAFTQPIMYAKIRDRPTLAEVYTEQLILQGDLTVAESEGLRNKFEEKLQQALDEARRPRTTSGGMRGFAGRWKGMSRAYSHAPVATGASFEMLRQVSEALTQSPEHFHVHPKIEKLLLARKAELAGRQPIDWAFAESLAFGTLLLEGTAVRLSGQDSRRGTFSQRHAVLYDARTGEPYHPLNHIQPEQAHFQVYDSLLSEAAVLGFEYGYSLDAPDTLVMWEAQFGDFANGAQVIIDQFIAPGLSKWQRDNGVVLLLPHGYEGQGPEHSSARPERYLQLCAEDNMQVCYPSTPAQYFHVLRRQQKRNFRKPLVLMTPKSLLRLPAARSPVEEFTDGRFAEVLDDAAAHPERVRRVILCSGKLYYDLAEYRDRENGGATAVVRLEQFYPFPEEQLRRVLVRYRAAREWVWAQEESQNMGGWSFVEPRLRALGYEVFYVGRDASASTATGSRHVHLSEQHEVVEAAFQAPATHLVRASGPVTDGDGRVKQEQAVAESR